MQPRSLEERVSTLEGQMLDLKEIPSRLVALITQFQQCREEIRNEVSSIRKEFKAAEEETRHFMRILHEDALSRIRVVGEGDDENR